MIHNSVIDSIITRALDEDIGNGDITTLATIDENKLSQGTFIVKEAGVICGLSVVRRVFELMDKDIVLDVVAKEGSEVSKGDVIAYIRGKSRGILTGERVALNLMQRMSGIATRTREAVKEIEGSGAVIADTRKTTPGLRVLEKYAVRIGGGTNHRFNLADGVLIKDNHIKAAGGITQAVYRARKFASHLLKIEVEVETFQQIDEALACGADVIMLDNMSLDDMKRAVEIINGRAIVEASGNMGERNLSEVSQTGVNIISIGALTHTIKALDISLRFE